jgi:hypothetical protein
MRQASTTRTSLRYNAPTHSWHIADKLAADQENNSKSLHWVLLCDTEYM